MNMETAEINSSENKYLVFGLEDRLYGIEINYLSEIIPVPQITEVPNMKDYVTGVADLRGKVIPVFDTRVRLGMAFCEVKERTCLIVLNIRGIQIGFIADSVQEVMEISRDATDPLQNMKEIDHSEFISAAGRLKNDQMVILLNAEKMVSGEHSLGARFDK